MVNEMVSRVGETLNLLEKFAKKYEILGSGSKRRQMWAKFKWSMDFSKIDGLRNKVGTSLLRVFSILSTDGSMFISSYITTPS